MTSVFTYTSDAQLDRSVIKDQVVFLVDASAGNVTITLPDLLDNSKDGSTFSFIKADSTANTVTVQTSGAFIYQDGTDYTKMQAESEYSYNEFVIINGLYKALIGEWLAVA
jgi:hypothetical protein